MSIRRLSMLQWVGLLAGLVVWIGQHIVGWGITEAECGAGSGAFGIENDVWQGALLAASALAILAAEAAAIAVILGTRRTSYEAPPPPGRIRFFAIAAALANVIFLVIVLLDGFAAIFDVACRQA
jgi:hypothetical protein